MEVSVVVNNAYTKDAGNHHHEDKEQTNEELSTLVWTKTNTKHDEPLLDQLKGLLLTNEDDEDYEADENVVGVGELPEEVSFGVEWADDLQDPVNPHHRE